MRASANAPHGTVGPILKKAIESGQVVKLWWIGAHSLVEHVMYMPSGINDVMGVEILRIDIAARLIRAHWFERWYPIGQVS